jgi:hypothetical protein
VGYEGRSSIRGSLPEAEHLAQVKHGHAGELVVAVGQVDLLVGGCGVVVPAGPAAMMGHYMSYVHKVMNWRWAGWLAAARLLCLLKQQQQQQRQQQRRQSYS